MIAQPTINNQTTLVQASGQLTSEIDNEIVLLNMETETYYSMDAVGTRIWQLLAQPHQVSQLCEQLQLEFGVDQATCERDVLEFVQRLANAQLVQIVPT